MAKDAMLPSDIRPYSGIRVLDLTVWLGTYASRLFADLGADVLRIEAMPGEPQRGVDPEAAARFAFLNASKTLLHIDLASTTGQELLSREIERSQLIFVERDGPMWSRLGEFFRLAPSAVTVVCSPYGIDGVMRHAPACDLSLQAAGGIAWMSGRPADAPLALPEGQVAMVTSIYAANVAAIALVDAERRGVGHLIDVSAQECIAHSLQNAIQVWDLERRVSRRGGEGTRDAAEAIIRCSDGFVFVASPLSLGPSWPALVNWVASTGHPAAVELSAPRWSDRKWRLTQEAHRAFSDSFGSFAVSREKAELTREAVARRIVMAPVNRISDLICDEQLTHRGFFVGNSAKEIFPGAPYRFSRDVWKTRSPAMPTAARERT